MKVKDLTAVGLSRPAARRLLAAVKRRKAVDNPGYLSEILQKVRGRRIEDFLNKCWQNSVKVSRNDVIFT